MIPRRFHACSVKYELAGGVEQSEGDAVSCSSDLPGKAQLLSYQVTCTSLPEALLGAPRERVQKMMGWGGERMEEVEVGQHQCRLFDRRAHGHFM